MKIRKLFRKKDEQFVTAKEAFESTKAPQLKKAIEKINESRQRGSMSTYVGDNEELHSETIDALLKKGYDVEVTHYDHADGLEWFNKAFWDSKASGKIRSRRRIDDGDI